MLSPILAVSEKQLIKRKTLKWREVKWLQDIHPKDKSQIHGAEEEDHSVEDVVVSVQFSRPLDKVQPKCSNLQHKQYKVNKDKWGTISAGDARDMDIGLMIAPPTVKGMDEVVEEDMYADVQEEEEEEEEVSNEDEDGIRQ